MDRQLLSRATEGTEAPTPGYMYLDIAKNAASNPAVCQEIANYLTRKLGSKNNANIKYKCLKIISKTATSPYLRGQFKRAISQDPTSTASIKEAIQFRGKPDPVRGDQPYERVREAAKEALDAIYSDTPADQGAGGASFATMGSGGGGGGGGGGYGNPVHSGGSGYGGYGSSSGGGGGGGPPPGGSMGGNSSGRMQGIGNPMFNDPRMQQGNQAGLSNMTLNDVVREAKHTVVGIIRDPLAKNTSQSSNRLGSVPRPGNSYGGPSSYPPGRHELAHQTGGQWTMASNRGPEAVTAPSNFNSERDQAYFKARDSGSNAYAWAQRDGANAGTPGGVGGSWASAPSSVATQAREPAYPPGTAYGNAYQATPSVTVTGGSAPSTQVMPGGGGTAASDGSYEKNLIMELCPPGGMKAEPPQDKLAQFARAVPSLNADLVCPALLDCLEEGQPWIIRAKALCVIETCLRSGQRPGTQSNPYADFLHACQGEILPLMTHNRSAIRDPASRVIKLMGLSAPRAGSVGAAAPLQPSAAPPMAAPVAVPPPNFLDFDDAPPPVPSVPPPAAPPAQPPQAPPAASSNSLFGGLKVANSAVPAPAPAPTPAPMSGNLLDLMAQSQPPAPVASAAAPAPSAAASQASSMFANMSIKAPTSATPAAAPAQPNPAETADVATLAAPGGSAFGFMNQSAAAPAPVAVATAPVSAVPAPAVKDSFDPLKNMTPNTAKQMMNISQEQMQALAYQQMMMQQQMQAMAYQQMMAQKRGSGVAMMPPGGAGGVMQNPAAAKTSFAFFDGQQQRRPNDKSFDFVKDAMTSEKKK